MQSLPAAAASLFIIYLLLYYFNLINLLFQIDDAALQIYRSYEGGGGDFGTYLDSDLALSDQPDELDILRSDP